MNLIASLTPQQLRRAAEIKEKIQPLENELARILGGLTTGAVARAPRSRRRRKMSAEARARISAAMTKRWASKRPATAGQKPKRKGKMSPAAKAKLSARMKEIWAKRRAAKK